MDYIIICLAALIGSALTLFSGFGLGTILVPVFAIFFPIEIAIALTAVVHFLNNLFKLALLGKKANKNVVLRFGFPSVVAAFLLRILSFFYSPVQSKGTRGLKNVKMKCEKRKSTALFINFFSPFPTHPPPPIALPAGSSSLSRIFLC